MSARAALSARQNEELSMRKIGRPKRTRSAVKPSEEIRFDLAALCLATWLGMLVLVKCVEMLPSLPPMPTAMEGGAWNMAALGT